MSINRLYVRQMVADMLVAWLKWQHEKGGSKQKFEASVDALAAYLVSIPTPIFRSGVWLQALKISDRWRTHRKIPYHMMRKLSTIYGEILGGTIT